MTSSVSIKKKNFIEKEIFDFLNAIEERFNYDELKIKEFIEIINQENSSK